MTRFTYFAACYFIFPYPAQQSSSKSSPIVHTSAEPESAAKPFPTHTLQFRRDAQVTGSKASPVFSVSFQCSANGSIFLQIIDPADMFKPSLYSVKEGKAQKFDWSSVAGFTDSRLIGYFPAASNVAFLVQASRSTAKSTARDQTLYLLIFDADGEYQRNIPLEVNFTIMRFALLPSGKILVAGYDAVNDESELWLLDEGGKVLRAYDQTKTPEERRASKDRSGQIPGVAGMLAASKTYFVGYKDDVLAWQLATSDTVLDVSPSGAAREVSLSLPKGFAPCRPYSVG